MLVVAAAGNETSSLPEYPAAYPNVVAVGATSGAGRASFSNYGSWVTLAAPGVNIFSTTPTAGSTDFAPSYSSGDGTSFSTPIVVGEAALLKAQAPTATSLTLRAALVTSAHGFAGLGLGAGQVDFAAALQHIRPSSTPTLTAAGTAGTLSFTATSTATAVKFRVDSGAFTPAVATVGGVATYRWASWGNANGSHTAYAADCTLHGECATTLGSAPLTLANAAAAVTAPGPNALVSGAFTMTATSPGGGVRFLIDGVRRGFDATSPYSLADTGSALPDGVHNVRAVECSANESVCAGPSSPVIAFRSSSLHPSISAISPNPFSPNGDRARDTATVTFALPDSEATHVRVLHSTGALMRGPLWLGMQPRGAHTWIWNGKMNNGQLVPNGTYTVELFTSRLVNGVTVYGSVRKTVVADRSAPTLASITGSRATFYPYPDGYVDAFAPAVTVNEASLLSLIIRNSHGTAVRVITARKPAGRTSFSWNGRNSANQLLSAGTYLFSYKAIDGASNARTSPAYPVYLRSARLVAKSAVITKNGSTFSSVLTTNASCGSYSKTASDFYPNGVWLLNECDWDWDGPVGDWAVYNFTLPAAMRYSTLTLQAYGNTFYTPSEIFGAFHNQASGAYQVSRLVSMTSSANGWRALGSMAAAGYYSGRTATLGVGVDDYYGAPSDFDISAVRLTVTYYVLQ